MWRDNGEMESYMYYAVKPEHFACGESWDWTGGRNGGRSKTNVWHEVVTYLQVNDVGAPHLAAFAPDTSAARCCKLTVSP